MKISYTNTKDKKNFTISVDKSIDKAISKIISTPMAYTLILISLFNIDTITKLVNLIKITLL